MAEGAVFKDSGRVLMDDEFQGRDGIGRNAAIPRR